MKRKIIEVAAMKFAEKGNNVSLAEIAKIVGIKKQSIYNYFESKDDLFYQMLELEITSYFDGKEREFYNLRDLSTEEKLKKIFFSIINYFKDLNKLRFWRWILLIDSEELYDKTGGIIHDHELRFIELMRKIFTEGIEGNAFEEENYKRLLRMYLALVHGTLDSMLFYKNLVDPDEFANSVWEAFWNGIKKR